MERWIIAQTSNRTKSARDTSKTTQKETNKQTLFHFMAIRRATIPLLFELCTTLGFEFLTY